jgi:hypothetical protein
VLSAISTLVSKTIDVFLKINSAESRRRKFSKDIFAVYGALDDIAQVLCAMEMTVEELAGLRDPVRARFRDRRIPGYVVGAAFWPEGIVELQTYQLGEDGAERLSPRIRVDWTDILPAVLSSDLRNLNRAIGTLSRLMVAQSFDLFQLQHQPDKLKALGIFDEKLVKTFTRAWFSDGGFVEALCYLRLDQEIDGKVLRLLDADFDPQTSPLGYDVDGVETRFSLDDRRDVAAFLELCRKCRGAVVEARDHVKQFISKTCKIEDIL